MKAKMKKVSILLIITFLVSGCMAVQRLTMSDIRNEKYFYKSYVLDKKLIEIAEILYEFGQRCRPLPNLTIEPTSKKRGYISWKRYFTANPTIIGLMDFSENEEGTTTKINAYWYYTSIDGKLSDRIVSIIKSPDECRDLY